MNETQKKGITTELQCQLALVQENLNVLTPISPDCRYDMVIDIQNVLYRIQVKTSRLTTNNTGIVFNTCSSRMNHTNGNMKEKYSEEDIDFFATYYNNKMYLIPVHYCQGNERTLVFQHNSCHNNLYPEFLLEDYELQKIIQHLMTNGYDFQPKEAEKKVVCQYDKKGNLLNTFSTYQEAANNIGNPKGIEHISQAARGLRQSAYGYIWKMEIK